MFLLDWYREFLRIRDERLCQNCEYLKNQIEIEQQFNKVLFEKLTAKPEVALPPAEPQVPFKPRFTPWRVRKQMLEEEDRRAAAVMRMKEQEITLKSDDTKLAPPDDPDVIALEKELGILEKERENASKIG